MFDTRDLVSLTLATALGGLVLATQPAAADEAIGDLIERVSRKVMADHDVPGMAVGIISGGKPESFVFGNASPTGRKPVTADTLFEIGSVSKTFTATVGAYAVATGRMSLDDHPSRFMPALSGAAIDKATLADLATYSAGDLPLQFPDSVDAGGMSDYFRTWKPAHDPGSVRVYSNPSIGLFGHLAAQALGDDYASIVEQRMLPAFALGSTFIKVPDARSERYAWGTSKAGRAVRVNPGTLDAEAYGIKTSVTDLLRFVSLNMDPSGLPDDWRKAVEATHVGRLSVGEMTQGLGWEQYPWPVGLDRLQAGNSREMAMEPQAARPRGATTVSPPATLYNKTGSTGGFGAYVAFVPGERIAVVMLANRNFPIPARLEAAHRILTALAEDAD